MVLVSTRTKPKKKLVDVYRAVFAMRREVFTNRPIPKSEPAVVPSGIREFIDTCDAICATLFFLLSVLSPALPEETGSPTESTYRGTIIMSSAKFSNLVSWPPQAFRVLVCYRM